MVSRRLFLQSSAAAVAAYAASGLIAARAENAPGITDTEIKIGQSIPYSGPASGYSTIARAELAYFKMINEMGGVHGRKLNLISLDDGYSAPKTVEQTRRLIEEERVAFIFQTFGGFTNLAIRPYLNETQGAATFRQPPVPTNSTIPQHFPWMVGFNPATRHGSAHLRQTHTRHETRREDRRHLPERCAGEELPDRLARRSGRRACRSDRQGGLLRGFRSDSRLPGRHASGARGRHAHHRRDLEGGLADHSQGL